MPISRREARELMSRGYEVGARVLNGTVSRREDGTWAINGTPIDEWLDEQEGQAVIVIMGAIQDSGSEKRICRVCGTAYEGYDCPRCRQARQRLRGG